MTDQRKGLVPDVPEVDYHSDLALSRSGAFTLLTTSPARFQYELTHRTETAAFDVGHAAHAKVLGVGMPVVEIPADALGATGATNTKAAREFIATAREQGQVPLKGDVIASVDAMAEAVLAHPAARSILEREGEAELSTWWTDTTPDGEVECRARFDKVTTTNTGMPAVVDLKTTGKSAAPTAFAKSVVDYGYDFQASWYAHGFEHATNQYPAFVFIAVEKEPPHFVAVHTLDEFFLERGERMRREALDLFARCRAADHWPAHSDDINVLTPPRWAS